MYDQLSEELLQASKSGTLDDILKIFQEIDKIEPDQKTHADIKKMLVNQNGQLGWSPIHLAVFQNQIQIMKFFVGLHLDLNKTTMDGLSPLMLAIKKQLLEIVKLLADQPIININQITNKGCAIHLAVSIKNQEILTILLDKGADPNILNSDDHSCYDIETSPECSQLLKKYKLNCSQSPIRQKQQQQQHSFDEQEYLSPQKYLKNYDQSQEQKIVKKNYQISQIPIIRGHGFNYGQWICTIRERYFILDSKNGNLLKFKQKQDYPLKLQSIFAIKDIEHIKIIERGWYMQQSLTYIEFFYFGQHITIGFKNKQTAHLWINFISFIKYQQEQLQNIDQDVEQIDLEILDNPDLDQNVYFQFKQYFQNLVENQNKIQSNINQNINNLEPQEPDLEKSPLRYENKQHQHDSNKEEIKKNNENQQNSSNIQKINYSQQNQNQQKQIDQNEEERKFIQQNKNNKFNNFDQMENQSDNEKFKQELDEDYQKQKEVINFKSFKIIKLVGSGAFGQVYLVQKLNNEYIYAMKSLQKKSLILKKQLIYAYRESKALQSFDHPFIIKLHQTFQTPQFLYMVMDYCTQGDLSYILAQKHKLSEHEAKFYICELLLAIEYVHSKNIIYRDMKPENILIHEDGHIRLADFGMIKDNIEDGQFTKTFCGSRAYLAPEILNKKGASKLTDIYGIGSVLYEILMGESPYYDDDILVLYHNIRNEDLVFNSNVSENAKDLIKKMLERDTSLRIGTNGFQEIKNHPFFSDIDWDIVYQKKLIPPQFDFQEENLDALEIDNFQIENLFTDVDYNEENSKVNRVKEYSFIRNQ